MLKTHGETLDDDDIAELLKTAEVDKEGKINYYGRPQDEVKQLFSVSWGHIIIILITEASISVKCFLCRCLHYQYKCCR